MKKSSTILFIIFISFVLFSGSLTFLNAGDLEMPLSNPGLESIGSNNLPSDWTIQPQEIPSYLQVRTDTANFHSGGKSISIELTQYGSCTIISQPTTLQVGHLYRLSAWVKTQAALARETDRYPTSVPACIAMQSFPFTNHSPALGGTNDWQKIETLFIATKSKDRVHLNVGFNGAAVGKIWFDDIKVEKVDDISSYIPMETLKWFGPAFRYTDKGWIFVHIEGKPYERGYQYGYLLASEIVEFIRKSAIRVNENNIVNGWDQIRNIADAYFLRKYDEEYLTEMKGIADGAAKAGAAFESRSIDLQDIVAINSAIDISYVWSSLRTTPHLLTGKSFLKAEDELNIPMREHKCSGFLANGPATPNGDMVFGQIFMWSGYTGVHWNVMCDIVPEKGHRLVYETFPGGIHSGADFYLNAAGIVIGETTVSQTPFDSDGTPQSYRIRKAAQYASSIDDVVKIMTQKNNGMYTNDWLIADAKTNETAILLLGTKKYKLWRSSSHQFPGDTNGFFWSNNNPKDEEVRKECLSNPDNAPYDLIFSPWNRDLAFVDFYRKFKGKIDAIAGVNLWASSPINRSHACDGKITDTEMARNMVFLAHFGKVTLREKFPQKDYRLMPDLPGAQPHLSLGYSVVSPVFIADQLKAMKKTYVEPQPQNKPRDNNPSSAEPVFTYDSRSLWFNTVYPASNKENWFISGTAAYWQFLKRFSSDTSKNISTSRDFLTDLNLKLNYVSSREMPIAPVQAQSIYNAYGHYQFPRIRGTFLLHQLRLMMGNQAFSQFMNTIHDLYREKPVTNQNIIAEAEKIAGKPLKPFFTQWLERSDLPQITLSASTQQTDKVWKVTLDVKQAQTPFQFFTTIAIETQKNTRWEKIEVTSPQQTFEFTCEEKPLKLIFNAGNDIPVSRENFYIFPNYADEFHNILFVYGTSQQIEANHTLTLRFRDLLADQFTEILLPVIQDNQIDNTLLATHDFIVLGSPSDNTFTRQLMEKLSIPFGKNYFTWMGKTYGSSDDGLIAVFPNPYNSQKTIYLIIANSALQLYRMTRVYNFLPSWAIFNADQIVLKGYHPVSPFEITF